MNSIKTNSWVTMLLMLDFVAAGYGIYCGAKILSAVLLFSTIVVYGTCLFWKLSREDQDWVARPVLTSLPVGIFGAAMLYLISELNVKETFIVEDIHAVGNLFSTRLFVGTLVLSLCILGAFVGVAHMLMPKED